MSRGRVYHGRTYGSLLISSRSVSWNKSTSLAPSALKVDVQIRGQDENYFFWPSQAWAGPDGFLVVKLLDGDTSLSLIQTLTPPCSRENDRITGKVITITNDDAVLDLGFDGVSYVYIAGQAHNCCSDHRCLTIRAQASSSGTAASDMPTPSTTPSIHHISCSGTSVSTYAAPGVLPGFSSSSFRTSAATTVMSPISFVASESASPSGTAVAGGRGHGAVSPAIDNSAVTCRALSYSVIVVVSLTSALLGF